MSSTTSRIDTLERNLIINGNFDFWQRGTTKSSFTSAYLADRWNISTSAAYSGAAYTYSRSPDFPSQTLSGYQSTYSLLYTNGTGGSPGANDYQNIIYKMEGYDYQQIHNRKIRFQFWAKATPAGTYSVTFYSLTRTYCTAFTLPNTGWNKITIDLQTDSAEGWAFDNTPGLQISFNLTAGTTYTGSTIPNQWTSNANGYGVSGQTQWGATAGATFQLAQVSLIPQDFTQAGAANVDVPFQRCGWSIGHELALCQRYGISTVAGMRAYGYTAGTDTNLSMVLPIPVTMRANPTVTLAASVGGNIIGQTASKDFSALSAVPSSGLSNSVNFSLTATTSGLGTFKPVVVVMTVGFIDAEL